jgi:hypothetical protein
VRCEPDACGSGWGLVVGSCIHDSKPLGFIKGRGFLDCVTLSFSRRSVHHRVRLLALMWQGTNNFE